MMRLLLFGRQGDRTADTLARRLDRANMPFDMVCHDGRTSALRSVIGGGSLPLFVAVGSGDGSEIIRDLGDDGIVSIAAEFGNRANGPMLQKAVTALQLASNWQVVPLPVVIGLMPVTDPGFSLSLDGLVAVTAQLQTTRSWRWDRKC